ncbi:MAG: hypothetical protein ABEJ72_00245 [Candidatus Aenigmatarchaeota archaeon]
MKSDLSESSVDRILDLRGKVESLQGVYFTGHSRERNDFLDAETMPRLEQEILDGKPRWFYDRKHNRITAELHGLVIPLEVQEYRYGPGYQGFAVTAYTLGDEFYRLWSPRFIEITELENSKEEEEADHNE